MKLHLYGKKKPCPAVAVDIVLTDDIKEYILANRIYRVPVAPPPPTINQTINNFQNMNNFLSTIDPVQKLTQVTDYCKVEIKCLEDRIGNCYAKEIQCLEDGNRYDPLHQDDFMGIVNKLTKVIRGEHRNEFFEEMNVIYDSKSKRIKVYSGQWDEYLLNNGLKHLIHTIIEYYLEKYELYLIRKLSQSGIRLFDHNMFIQSIEEYYRFIGAFELKPFCHGKTDDELLENGSDDDAVARRFEAIYQTQYNGLTNAQRKTTQNNVLEIIKSNSKCNLTQLDKDIISLVNIDREFHQVLLAQFSAQE